MHSTNAINPKIAALMANIGGEEVKQAPKNEIPHPPETFEEFLKFEKVNEWPQQLTSERILDISEISHTLWTLDEIKTEIQESAPFGLESLSDMEMRLDEFGERLLYFSSYITSPEDRPSRIPENLFHAPRKEELDKASSFDAVKLHHSRKKKKKDVKQTMQEAAQASRTRNIDFVNFPGFRPKELTELPSQLEAPQILNRITEAQTFNKGFMKMWKKLFLSEASVAMLQDAFWWFFLEHFEHNPHAQDLLFTRISDSYVAMFFSAHPDIRDKFMVVFPRCLAQAIYLTFCEAFPESHDRFTEEFVAELAFLISEWIAGVKLPVDDWKKWPWSSMGMYPGGISDAIGGSAHERALGIHKNSEPMPDMSFDVDQILAVDDSAPSGGDQPPLRDQELPDIVVALMDEAERSAQVMTTDNSKHVASSRFKSGNSKQKKQRSMSFPAESAQAGPGPDYERVLFNMGGRSPLVAHHLYMKQLRDKDSTGRTMRRTEVLQQPYPDNTPPGMTYQDVIDKSKKTLRALNVQRERSQGSLKADVIKLQKARSQAVREIRRLQETLVDPLEIKIRSDKVLDQALEKGIHRQSDYGSSRTSSKHADLLLQDSNDKL